MDLKDYCKDFSANRMYVHIPFCKKKCNYCSFFSIVSEKVDDYKNALTRVSSYLRGEYESIYFGGGTPSLFNADFFRSFVKNVKGKEITVEGNPESMSIEWISSLFDTGINRFSVGVQSLNDNILKILGRIHTSEDSLKIIEYMSKIGVNYSVDLIIGIDKEYPQIESLKRILDYNPPHISVYILEVKEDLPISKYVKTDECFASEEYLQVCDLLRENGYIHYEISNFAQKENFISSHNMGYWERDSYIAVGSGAYGFNGKVRYKIKEDINGFINDVSSDKVFIILEEKVDDKISVYNETVMLSLRTYMGIELDYLRNSPCEDKSVNIGEFVNEGFMKVKGERCIMTEKGYLMFNSIVSQFLC